MPLVRFEVRNEVGLGDPDLYGGGGGGDAAAPGKRGPFAAAAGEEEPKALLEGVTVAGLVGILRQLGDLAEFAADVFHDLHEQVIATSARGRKVLTRVQNIEAALPSLEKAVKNQKSHIHFAYVPGSDWHTQFQNEQNHLLSSDLPRFMMDSYEECRDPPRLYLLDKFDNAGAGACLKRYSDPSYFKKAWDMMRADKTASLHREKRSQKIKRKGSRLREPYHVQATSRHRSGELQRSLTAGQLVNRQLASPSTDGQSFSEHKSTPDAKAFCCFFGHGIRSVPAHLLPGIRICVWKSFALGDRGSVFHLAYLAVAAIPLPSRRRRHPRPISNGAPSLTTQHTHLQRT